MPRSPAASALALLRRSDFRAFLAAVILAGTADSALAILLGVTVYHITRDPLALGWLGLIEAAPAIGLVPPTWSARRWRWPAAAPSRSPSSPSLPPSRPNCAGSPCWN